MKRSTSSATIRQPAQRDSSIWPDSWHVDVPAEDTQDSSLHDEDHPDPEYVRMVLYPWQLKRVK